ALAQLLASTAGKAVARPGGIALSTVAKSLRHSRPTSRLLPLVGLALAVTVLAATLSQPVEGASQDGWQTISEQTGNSLQSGELQNLQASTEGLSLSDDEEFHPNTPSQYQRFGLYTSAAVQSGPFDAISVDFEASLPQGTSLEMEVRVQTAANQWTPWQEVTSPGQAFAAEVPGIAAQYRATLLSDQMDQSPTLSMVRLETRATDATADEPQYQALASRPTVRVYGTREGLVGRTTANGHKIVEKDHFVALPSKKALNPKDGKDYQVEISYKGKKATVPVWDVGPWNVNDNYWDASREKFNDLARFTPQAHAAFFNNYNGGNDQFGRPVLYPAAIDIADGTFIDDLGMKGSDWVDVTFLWLDATAPPLVPMPVVVPKSGPLPQAIANQPKPASPTAVPTPTPLPKTWYFAEGSTSKPFDTWLLLQNPDPAPANAKITYMLPNGGQKLVDYTIKPASRMSIYVNTVAPDTEVSAMIESDRYISAERAMYFGQEGHDTVGTMSPSTTWYFAEGSTVQPFDTWLLMQNPNKEPANVTVTLYREDGSTATQKMLIPHVSRASLLVDDIVRDASVGAKIESDRPIVAERAVYKEKGKAGTDTIGASALSRSWYLAEGVTRFGFDTWLLMLNPNDVPGTAGVTYMLEDGSTVARSYQLPPRTRISVYVNQEVPGARVATKIDSDLPIVAERSVYFPDGLGAHNTMAAPSPSKLWYLPEGSTAKPFTENVLVMNPNAATANLTVSLMKEDGSTVQKQYSMKPTSRLTLEMNGILPDTAFSTKVVSDQPIVVERSMYFNDWKGGTNSMGIPR
ncbi:MAG TPA: hypothetical protein VHS28_00855, partial [Chloroflexota bacterium]|nr:hypothetical protein [Chloroflexota bacterium]